MVVPDGCDVSRAHHGAREGGVDVVLVPIALGVLPPAILQVAFLTALAGRRRVNDQQARRARPTNAQDPASQLKQDARLLRTCPHPYAMPQ